MNTTSDSANAALRDYLDALSRGPTQSSTTATELLLVDAEGLGKMLKLGTPDRPGSAAKAVNERIYRRSAMPPGMLIPGSKRRLWWIPTVVQWMRQFEGQSGSTTSRKRKPRVPKRSMK